MCVNSVPNRAILTRNPSPEGATDNSPALQRRENGKTWASPGGTTELWEKLLNARTAANTR
jgi:hypothetical protein